MSNQQVNVGVIGVGAMGQHHARVYEELPETNLVGVFDVDGDAAAEVASDHGTKAYQKDELLAQVDAVSLAVPTQYHYDEALTCIEAGVGLLIEKPVVEEPSRGRELARKARDAGVQIQVGHIERFNPAIRTLENIIPDLDIIAVKTERLGPPPSREIEDSAVIDLMIHDLDIVMSLLDEKPATVASAGVDGNRHATALLEFDSNVVATLTASRLTQRKVRRLEITATECLVEVDYLDQSIDIHRHSLPEYIEDNGDVRYRHESIIERPTVSNGEPLKKELRSFATAVRDGTDPPVTIEDGIRAVELASEVEEMALEKKYAKPEATPNHD